MLAKLRIIANNSLQFMIALNASNLTC